MGGIKTSALGEAHVAPGSSSGLRWSRPQHHAIGNLGGRCIQDRQMRFFWVILAPGGISKSPEAPVWSVF